MNGTELLASFRNSGAESDFTELVRRYTNLVYSAAKRRLANPSLAEDVTQTVFSRLAGALPNLRTDAELAAWLHRTTLHVAVDVWRSESRRHAREQIAASMTPSTTQDSFWTELAPVLDEALNRLNNTDRQALLLRFFNQKTMRDVGQILGISEDAAKMRVGRAIERLRTQLSKCGVVCTAITLSAALLERSVEAAPGPLVARLGSLKRPASAAPIGIVTGFRQASGLQLATGLGLIVFAAAVAVMFLRSLNRIERNRSGNIAQNAASLSPSRAGSGEQFFARRAAALAAVSRNAEATKAKMKFRVVEAETGAGLTGAKIRAAYFGVGGQGEGRSLITDETGLVGIPEPSDATKNQAMNVFVIAEGRVPRVASFHGTSSPPEYTIRLERALAVAGRIVDPENQPMAGVNIRVQNPGNKDGATENVDFQNCTVTTDSGGRWAYPYIPSDFKEIRFILTRDDCGVTLPVVPVGKFSLTNLVFIMDRGFIVAGRITDSDGQPVIGAEIKELNNTGYRRQSAQSDENGRFTIQGLSRYESYMEKAAEISGSDVVVRGMEGQGQPSVDLVVQADGFAPQLRSVPLVQLTNVADFRLANGKLFKGRIVDADGNPISNAVVRTDSDNHGIRRFNWTTRTDADGRFEWNSAPDEPVLFWFEADGFGARRDVRLVADGSDHVIRLERNPAAR